MEKKNSKAVVICITFVIIALAAGIFIGWMIGKHGNESKGETLSEVESLDLFESQSETAGEVQTEISEETVDSSESENAEVVVTVGEHKVGMKEINYRLYSLRNYFIQTYGEEPWNNVITDDGKTVAEVAKTQLEDDIVRTEILVDCAKDFGVIPSDSIKSASASDAKALIDGLGADICNEFGLTLEGVESVFLKREIATQVMTVINDQVRGELLQDPENKKLDEAALEIKISEGCEAKYQEIKKAYTITYSELWENIVVGSVG